MADGPARPAADDFDAAGLARTLLRETAIGSLATVEPESGAPFVSLVTVAPDASGAPLILISGLSAHTRHLAADPRASILLAAIRKGDPLAHPRLTVSGIMEPAADADARKRFLARHPKARLYVDFPDFGFRRMTVLALHLNGGFARAARLVPGDVLDPAASAAG